MLISPHPPPPKGNTGEGKDAGLSGDARPWCAGEHHLLEDRPDRAVGALDEAVGARYVSGDKTVVDAEGVGEWVDAAVGGLGDVVGLDDERDAQSGRTRPSGRGRPKWRSCP